MTYSLNWDLDSIFPGGSASTELNERLAQLERQIETYYEQINQWSFSSEDIDSLVTILALQEKVTNGFSQCNSYITAFIIC